MTERGPMPPAATTMPPAATTFTEEQIRAEHRRHMQAIGESEDTDWDHQYENLVVAAIVGFQRGERERPYSHAHAETEIGGGCSECDAAFTLQELNDGEGTRDA
jgi:hypothetical protein